MSLGAGSHYGVVPVENSTEGVVNHTLDMFIDSDLQVIAEIMLEISHNLMSKSGQVDRISKIVSHPQPLAQCRHWLETNHAGYPAARRFQYGCSSSDGGRR